MVCSDLRFIDAAGAEMYSTILPQKKNLTADSTVRL